MDNRRIKTSQHSKKNSSQLQQASLLDSEEETMDMQESLSKQQSTSPWQELQNLLHRSCSKCSSRNTSQRRSRTEEHLAQYKSFKRVKQALKDIILEAVEHGYLLEIEDNTLGFLNQTPRQMIDHLKVRGGALDFADTKTLLTERDME